jgi:hypothetical protein
MEFFLFFFPTVIPWFLRPATFLGWGVKNAASDVPLDGWRL